MSVTVEPTRQVPISALSVSNRKCTCEKGAVMMNG